MEMQLLLPFASVNKAAVVIQLLWLRSPWRHPPASSAGLMTALKSRA